MANYPQAGSAGTSAVTSVAGRTGAVTLAESDVAGLASDLSAMTTAIVAKAAKAANLSDLTDASAARTNLGLGSVSNTSDAAKPVSTATQAALDLKAPLASPALTGTPTAPTAAAATNTTQVATTAFVRGEVTALVNSAPSVLDTLGEIAAALQSDESTASALATTVAGKLAAASNLSDVASAATARSNLGASQAISRTAVKTSAYTAAGGDLVPVDTTSGAVTVTLPTAPATGSRVAVKHIVQGGSNAVTVACGGSDVFNRASGSTSLTLPLSNQGMLLEYDAGSAVWTVVADDIPLSQLDLRFSPLAGSTSLVTAGTIAAGTWHGTAIAAGYGGTGLDTSAAANGKLLIGNGSGLTLANLTAGSNITITNGAGSVTIASTGGGSPGGSTNQVQYNNAGSFAGSANLLFDGTNLVYLCGASAAAPLIVRQTGGTAGTSEVQLKHDGTRGYLQSMGGDLYLRPANGVGIRVKSDGSSRSYVESDASTHWVSSNATVVVVGASGSAVGFWSTNLLRIGSGAAMAWSSATDPTQAGNDTGLARAAAGVGQATDGSTGPGGLSSAARTPTTLAANTNNYSPGVGLFQRWSASTPVNVTGMAAGQAGEWRWAWNVGSSTITLTNQDASSTAANRWLTSTGADLALAANKCALAQYDATSACWRATLLP